MGQLSFVAILPLVSQQSDFASFTANFTAMPYCTKSPGPWGNHRNTAIFWDSYPTRRLAGYYIHVTDKIILKTNTRIGNCKKETYFLRSINYNKE